MKFWKIILAGVLTTALFITSPSVALYAEEPQTEEKTEEQKRQEEMDAVYAIPVDTNSLTDWPQGPSIYAESAIVMDMNSGAILYGKQIDKQQYPASITKILTTLVALENGNLTDKVLFSQDSVSFLEYGDAHIGMKPGEEITLNDALYAVLLASANEVSYAVAENVGETMGGGYDTFIQEMNDRAEELGCTGSHWVNANGLHDDEHYTTAHDMALIGAEAFSHEEFRNITQTLQYTIPPTNLVAEQRVFQQNHKMLFPDNQYYYEYCKGGKTGYTDQAKTTLVTFADDGNMQLVAVNLKSYGVNVYTDARAMFDYVYGNFSKILLEDYKDEDKIEKYLEDDAYVVLPEGIDVEQLDVAYELVEDGERREAVVQYTYEGQSVGSVNAILQVDFYKELTKESNLNIETVEDTQEEEMHLPAVVMAGIAAAAVIIVVVIIRIAAVQHQRNRRRRERRKAYEERRKKNGLRDKRK